MPAWKFFKARFFGERALLKNEPRAATIKVVSTSVTQQQQPRQLELFRRIQRQHGSWGKNFDGWQAVLWYAFGTIGGARKKNSSDMFTSHWPWHLTQKIVGRVMMSDARFVCSFVCCCTVGSSTGVPLFTIVCHRLPPFNFMYVCMYNVRINVSISLFHLIYLHSQKRTFVSFVSCMYLQSLISFPSIQCGIPIRRPSREKRRNWKNEERVALAPNSRRSPSHHREFVGVERANKTMEFAWIILGIDFRCSDLMRNWLIGCFFPWGIWWFMFHGSC